MITILFLSFFCVYAFADFARLQVSQVKGESNLLMTFSGNIASDVSFEGTEDVVLQDFFALYGSNTAGILKGGTAARYTGGSFIGSSTVSTDSFGFLGIGTVTGTFFYIDADSGDIILPAADSPGDALTATQVIPGTFSSLGVSEGDAYFMQYSTGSGTHYIQICFSDDPVTGCPA